VNITRYVNFKTIGNLQNEYKISMIGQYVRLDLNFLWLTQRNTSRYKKKLRVFVFRFKDLRDIFTNYRQQKDLIFSVNDLKFLNLQTE
jgi:hypothetical protein